MNTQQIHINRQKVAALLLAGSILIAGLTWGEACYFCDWPTLIAHLLKMLHLILVFAPTAEAGLRVSQ